MFNTKLEYLIDEYMVYCRSRQLREKTMLSYEQALRLFERWCKEEMKIVDVLDITESVIRKYINDTQTRGKYTFYTNDNSKDINYPERRRDFQKPVSKLLIEGVNGDFNTKSCEVVYKRRMGNNIVSIGVGEKEFI